MRGCAGRLEFSGWFRVPGTRCGVGGVGLGVKQNVVLGRVDGIRDGTGGYGWMIDRTDFLCC